MGKRKLAGGRAAGRRGATDARRVAGARGPRLSPEVHRAEALQGAISAVDRCP